MNGQARLQFVTWLKNKYPNLYYAAMDQAEMAGGNLAGLGFDPSAIVTATSEPSIWERFSAGALALGSTYLSLQNQRDEMKLNLARAEQGLPPIEAGSTGPVLRTEIDLSDDVVEKIVAGAGVNINKVLIFAAVGLGAFMLLRK
jgi:hypothetical protein